MKGVGPTELNGGVNITMVTRVEYKIGPNSLKCFGYRFLTKLLHFTNDSEKEFLIDVCPSSYTVHYVTVFQMT